MKSPHQIPTFPRFTALEPSHQVQIDQLVSKFEPYSDYNFFSLWSWDHESKLKVSLLNGNLVVRFQDYSDPKQFFYSFLGGAKVDRTTDTLLEFSSKEGQNELKLIPEMVVKKIKNKKNFIIEEDRDSFDYIVGVKDGGHNSKNLSQFLKRSSGKLSVAELDITDKKNRQQMQRVVESWQAQMAGHSSYNDSEINALNKIFNDHSKINTDRLHVVGIYLSDDLKGFAINEILDGGFAMGHYKKTDRLHRGLDDALVMHTVNLLKNKGVKDLNYEQDLGLEGLREAKLSYEPDYFLKKYTITRKV